MDAMNLKRKIAMLEAENKQLREKADVQSPSDPFARGGGGGRAVTNDDRNWMGAFGGGGGPT